MEDGQADLKGRKRDHNDVHDGWVHTNILRTQIPAATCSLTNYNANGSMRAPETSNQPQQLSRLESVKRRWKEEFASLVFNIKPSKKVENLYRVDKEINCTNIQRNKDKNMEDGQVDLKGRKRDHNDVHDGWVHTNILRTQIPAATCSSTNYNANGSVRAPEIPNQPQQLSRLESVKRRWKEEVASLVFNMKPSIKVENLYGVDKEINCTNIQRNKDKNIEDGQADLKGRKRDHNDVHDGWVHTNILRTQIQAATCSSINYNANGSVRAPETPNLPQQLSRLESVKRRWKEEIASLVFNMKPSKKVENLYRVDKEINCTNIQRNKDKNIEDGQADLKGRK